jgi:hypothetical protein
MEDIDYAGPAEKPPATSAASTDMPREVQDVVVKRVQEQFRQYAGANLKIDEAEAIVVDERGGVEYRCFSVDDAQDMASRRVQDVGGVHTIFTRYAAVRPPRAEVIIEK